MTAEELHAMFTQYGRTLGSVESFTGGRFASSMTAIPGASKFFVGAYVTYATWEKIRLLNIKKERVDAYGVVSQEIAGDMAMHGRFLLDSDYCISFTGNAGPTPMENKPVGLIYIGVSAYNYTQVFQYRLNGTREEIISQAQGLGYAHLAKMLQDFK